MDQNVPVLTIDGPSGSGKGTISRAVAQRLGWHYLDSGALYRAVGVAAGWADEDFADHVALMRLAFDTHIEFRDNATGEPRVIVDGVDATDELRTAGLVADGRDMGTVIFPDARFKVFLTASAEERAERRYNQLKQKGLEVTLDGLLREILARDARDAQRAVAPLKPAFDAVIVDTTGVGIDAVVEQVLSLLPESLRS